jgi:hypothetical protein
VVHIYNFENSCGINDLSVDMCDLYTVIFKLWCFSNFGVFRRGGGCRTQNPEEALPPITDNDPHRILYLRKYIVNVPYMYVRLLVTGISVHTIGPFFLDKFYFQKFILLNTEEILFFLEFSETIWT